jgi:hypothetical protein
MAVGAQSSDAQQLISVDDLTGGLDLRASPTQLDPDRARRCRNWSMEEPGAIIVERGYVDYMASLGASRLQGSKRIYLADEVFTLVAFGGDLYKPNDGGVPGAAVSTAVHATNQVDFVYDRSLVAAFDGSSTPIKSLDGTTWTQLGIAAPLAAPSLAAVAGGSLVDTNTYEVSYAYRDTAGTGDTGNESATATQAVSGANLTVEVTVVASADPQVDTIVVYARNVTAGEEVRREVGTRSNANGTFDITGPDTDWETADEAFTTHNVAEPMRFGVYWKNRFWGADATVGNRLRFTDLFLPQAWPALFFVDIPFARGDRFEAAMPLGDVLVCFGKTSLILIVGQSSLDFEIRPAIGPQDGALGFRSVCEVEGQILHAGGKGAYLFDGATDRLLSYDIDVGWRDLVKNASVATLSTIAVVYHGAFKVVRVGVPRLYPYAEPGEWVLDLNRTREKERPVWTSTSRDVGGYLYWDGDEPSDGNRERLFIWPTTALGKLDELNVGTDLDGADQTAEFQTAEFVVKYFMARFLELHVECEASDGTFTIEVYVDRRLVTTIAFDIGTAGALYGTAVYGTSTYTGVQQLSLPVELPLEAEGRTVYLRAIYVGKKRFRWFGFFIPAVPEPAIRSL